MSNKMVFQMDADEGTLFRTLIITAYVDESKDILIGEELVELVIDKGIVQQR